MAEVQTQIPPLESLPRTKEGWIPIEYFSEELFASGDPFLVQLHPDKGDDSPMVDKAIWIRDPLGDESVYFAGEWRCMPGFLIHKMEPKAFRPMPPTANLDELRALTLPAAA
ncbi:hypothetical protein [Rhodomicrobium lacus]|uniref:hypothetical protein n=1 Tax=Rhodomicrobium lacus TaxID=2498452 RepID=UPI000F8CC396|nr:hypothetical protein [Rhodomicrobium lacus]